MLLARRSDPPLASSGSELRAWTCRVHNRVNEALNKPLHKCEEGCAQPQPGYTRPATARLAASARPASTGRARPPQLQLPTGAAKPDITSPSYLTTATGPVTTSQLTAGAGLAATRGYPGRLTLQPQADPAYSTARPGSARPAAAGGSGATQQQQQQQHTQWEVASLASNRAPDSVIQLRNTYAPADSRSRLPEGTKQTRWGGISRSTGCGC